MSENESVTLHRVAVYGSLKSDKHNHRVMGGSQYLGRGTTVLPYIVKSNGAWPVCIQAEGEGRNVAVEVYEVHDEKRRQLDAFEGHPTLFTRDTTRVDLEGHGEVECHIYLGNTETWRRWRDMPDAPVVDGRYVW